MNLFANKLLKTERKVELKEFLAAPRCLAAYNLQIAKFHFQIVRFAHLSSEIYKDEDETKHKTEIKHKLQVADECFGIKNIN